MNNLNPFKLFGIDYNKFNENDLKKKYYELSLLCHPDKGGSKDDMNILHNAYNYVKEQIQNCKDIDTYEKMEQNFEDFCSTQESKMPDFNEIFKESNDYKRHIEFNKQFELKKKSRTDMINDEPESEYTESTDANNYEYQSFYDNGYSEFMNDSEYSDENTEYKPDIDNKTNIFPPDKMFPNILKNQLTLYKEPESNPFGYGDNFRFDLQTVEDYSSSVNNITASDYKKAFTILGKETVEDYKIHQKTLEELIQERESLLLVHK